MTMTDELIDARINGDGTVAPGTYGTIVLNGAGTITGDVTCRELKINGAGRCRGSVTADVVTVNGTGTFDGPVQAAELSVSGTADVHAGIGAGVLKVRGTVSADGGIHARDIDLKGDLRTGGGVKADKLFGEGRFAINGPLEAGDIDLRIHGKSSASEITCERMILKVPDGITAVFSAFSDRELAAATVRGGELELISVVASLVSGTKVTLGEGCRVGRVEYSDTLQKLSGALATQERKVESV
jgi:cytoskeletal protein CcmA (bactofilin family)